MAIAAPRFQQAVQRFGLAGAGQAARPAATPAVATPRRTPAAQPRQPFQQQVQQLQQRQQQPQYGLAGAGLRAQQQPTNMLAHPAAAAPAAAHPAAAAPAAASGGGQYINGQWVPQITQTTTLSPTEQALLEQQQGLQKQFGTLGATLGANVPTAPMSFAGAPALPTAGGYNQSAADAVYKQQTAYLDPQYQVQEQQQKDTLRDQGIPEGSDAYNQAMDAFNRNKTFAYQQAQDSATQEGYNVANQQFGQGMQARQQGVSEAQNLYQQPSNTLAQLMSAYGGTGGIQMPQANYNPGQIGSTDIAGINTNMAGLQQQQYGQQMQQYGSNMGNISGLAGMLGAAALMGK